MTGSKLWKEYKAVYCHPACLTYMQSTSCEMPAWMSNKLQSKFLGKYQQPHIGRWYHSNGRKWRGLKSLLLRVKEESGKAVLKLNIPKTKIMPSVSITSWQIEGKKAEAVANILILGSRITADGNCSHEIRRRLLLGRKAMTNQDRVLKRKEITLPTKVHVVKAIAFLVVMYGCESCTKERLSVKELMLPNCGAGEDSWESLGQ